MKEEDIYRIKTISEFEKDFGPNWRDRVRCSFPSRMDHLLGEKISKDAYESALNVTCYKGFNISKDMVIAEPCSPLSEYALKPIDSDLLEILDTDIKGSPAKQIPSKKISFPF